MFVQLSDGEVVEGQEHSCDQRVAGDLSGGEGEIMGITITAVVGVGIGVGIGIGIRIESGGDGSGGRIPQQKLALRGQVRIDIGLVLLLRVVVVLTDRRDRGHGGVDWGCV